jgi:hypothetical protein
MARTPRGQRQPAPATTTSLSIATSNASRHYSITSCVVAPDRSVRCADHQRGGATPSVQKQQHGATAATVAADDRQSSVTAAAHARSPQRRSSRSFLAARSRGSSYAVTRRAGGGVIAFARQKGDNGPTSGSATASCACWSRRRRFPIRPAGSTTRTAFRRRPRGLSAGR